MQSWLALAFHRDCPGSLIRYLEIYVDLREHVVAIGKECSQINFVEKRDFVK